MTLSFAGAMLLAVLLAGTATTAVALAASARCRPATAHAVLLAALATLVVLPVPVAVVTLAAPQVAVWSARSGAAAFGGIGRVRPPAPRVQAGGPGEVGRPDDDAASAASASADASDTATATVTAEASDRSPIRGTTAAADSPAEEGVPGDPRVAAGRFLADGRDAQAGSDALRGDRARHANDAQFGAGGDRVPAGNWAALVAGARLPVLPRPLAAVLLAAWAVGVLWRLARLRRGWRATVRLRRSLRPATDAGLVGLAAEAAAAVGLARPAPVCLSRHVATPLTLGLRRPTVVLPADLPDRTTAAEMRAILLHESAHLVRRDLFAGLLQRVAAALHWPNPLLRWLDRRLDAAREDLCDGHVVRRRQDGLHLAALLVRLAERAAGHVEPVPAARLGFLSGDASLLERRITRLLTSSEEDRPMSLHSSRSVRGLLTLATAASLSLAAVAIAWVVPYPQPPGEPDAAEPDAAEPQPNRTAAAPAARAADADDRDPTAQDGPSGGTLTLKLTESGGLRLGEETFDDPRTAMTSVQQRLVASSFAIDNVQVELPPRTTLERLRGLRDLHGLTSDQGVALTLVLPDGGSVVTGTSPDGDPVSLDRTHWLGVICLPEGFVRVGRLWFVSWNETEPVLVRLAGRFGIDDGARPVGLRATVPPRMPYEWFARFDGVRREAADPRRMHFEAQPIAHDGRTSAGVFAGLELIPDAGMVADDRPLVAWTYGESPRGTNAPTFLLPSKALFDNFAFDSLVAEMTSEGRVDLSRVRILGSNERDVRWALDLVRRRAWERLEREAPEPSEEPEPAGEAESLRKAAAADPDTEAALARLQERHDGLERQLDELETKYSSRSGNSRKRMELIVAIADAGIELDDSRIERDRQTAEEPPEIPFEVQKAIWRSHRLNMGLNRALIAWNMEKARAEVGMSTPEAVERVRDVYETFESRLMTAKDQQAEAERKARAAAANAGQATRRRRQAQRLVQDQEERLTAVERQVPMIRERLEQGSVDLLSMLKAETDLVNARRDRDDARIELARLTDEAPPAVPYEVQKAQARLQHARTGLERATRIWEREVGLASVGKSEPAEVAQARDQLETFKTLMVIAFGELSEVQAAAELAASKQQAQLDLSVDLARQAVSEAQFRRERLAEALDAEDLPAGAAASLKSELEDARSNLLEARERLAQVERAAGEPGESGGR